MVGVVGSSPIEPTNENETSANHRFTEFHSARSAKAQKANKEMALRTLTETHSERR
ncbi:hypothetical protein BURKHO8Y_170160 [Burkholderia sp. 8Y]|nr:hypothetical protein BURKHO8Y_170160 [Burkholderia sp. 8Y]